MACHFCVKLFSSSCGRISYEYHNENDPALHSGKFFLNFWKILAFFFKWNFEKYKLIKIVRNVPRDLYSKYNNFWYHQVLNIKFFRKNVCVQWKQTINILSIYSLDIQNSEIHQQQGWLLIFFPPLLIYSFQQKKWDFSREIMIRGARQPENLFKFAVPVCDNVVLCSPCDSDFF